MAAMTMFKGLGDPPVITCRANGSAATCTAGSFGTLDATNFGVTDSAATQTCCGIILTTTVVEDAKIEVAIGGVWKATATAAIEPGEVFYLESSTTIGVGAQSEVSQGIVVETTVGANGTTVYFLLIPSEIYTATTHA